MNNIDLCEYEKMIQYICNIASYNVLQENKKLNIPLVYSIDNTIYYQTIDGNITKKSPFL